METLFILFVLFVNGPDTQLEIYQAYTQSSTCMRMAQEFDSKEPDKRYHFLCRPVSFTVA